MSRLATISSSRVLFKEPHLSLDWPRQTEILPSEGPTSVSDLVKGTNILCLTIHPDPRKPRPSNVTFLVRRRPREPKMKQAETDYIGNEDKNEHKYRKDGSKGRNWTTLKR